MMASMRAARVGPWVVIGVTALLLGGAGVLDALSSRSTEPLWTSFVFVIAVAMSSGVGYVLVNRWPGNVIGWLLLANGLVLSLSGLATNYATYGILEHPGALPGADWAALYDERTWPLLFAAFTGIAFVFPDGRLPSPRWRPVVVVALGAFVVMTVTSLFERDTLEAPFAGLSNPLPHIPEAVFFPLFAVSAAGMLASLFAAAAAVLLRLRRSSGLERTQIKLLAYAATLIPATVAACWIEGIANDGNTDLAAGVGFGAVVLAIPLAIGVSVMRYRLYEVDRLINRTLVYALLTAALGATYAAVSLSVGVALGSGSTVPTAAATLAVALAFGALRQRVQRVVDKRFSPERYEGLRRVERHLAELRAGQTAPEATGAVLAEALHDPTLELLFWIPNGEFLVDATGSVAAVSPGPGRAVTPVRRGSLQLGVVVHDRALSERPDVLESVIEAAGLAVEIARLRAEVAHRLAEVEQSRARIVTAGYQERRRLERDLHDGAQQRLVSIGLSLRNIQAHLPADDGGAREELNRSVDGLTDAIEELRELARGVRPACLDDGLAPALRELATRSPLQTKVHATTERFEEGVEAAAYFVASEALTNSAKYARASHVDVTAERRNGTLVLSVSDDGVGGAEATERSGLAGITDRVAALGGSVRVSSPPGEGTAITAELPCAS
jgi:signal transduction histidine kinase